MGTATEAINALSLSEANRALFVAHIAVADAVCYVFGAVGVDDDAVGSVLLRASCCASAIGLRTVSETTRTKHANTVRSLGDMMFSFVRRALTCVIPGNHTSRAHRNPEIIQRSCV